MRLRIGSVFFLALALAGADKKIEPAKAGNDNLEVSGLALVNRAEVTKALGVDPGVEIIAIDIRLTPKSEGKLAVSRDDFTLISRRDGQRSQAMHPSQIAGSGVMVVSSRGPGATGGMAQQQRGPIWGGMPGTGGRPRRLGGDQDVSGVADAETKATISDTKEKDNPVLGALKEKELGEKEITEQASGLLYFLFEGKHKLKDLELMYKGPGGNLMLDFQK
jgi:hypothetical protein